jgi:hypothetical protein
MMAHMNSQLLLCTSPEPLFLASEASPLARGGTAKNPLVQK